MGGHRRILVLDAVKADLHQVWSLTAMLCANENIGKEEILKTTIRHGRTGTFSFMHKLV